MAITKADLALHIFRRLRREKTSHVTRYLLLLAISKDPDHGSTPVEIATLAGCRGENFESYCRGLVTAGLARIHSTGPNRYTLTAAGRREAESSLDPS